MNFFKRIVLPMIILLLIAAAFLLAMIARFEKAKESAAQSDDKPQTQKISNLSNINPADFDTIVKNEYALASLKAQESNPENKLSAIDIEIASSMLPSSVVSRYIFSSPANQSDNWTMTFTQLSNNFTRALIPKDDYIGNVSEINTKLWKFNFITALQIAEKNGGLKWREENNLKSIRITLKHTEPKNWLIWAVQYKDETSSMTIKLDANSGRIVDDEEAPEILPE